MEAKSLKLLWILSISALNMLEFTTSYRFRNSQALPGYVSFKKDQSCPTDCICTAGNGYREANCKRLPMGPQKFGSHITQLDIYNAEIDIQLDDFIFMKLGLSQVERIKIVNSNITSIGTKAFNGLPELCAVDLSNNKLKDIHSETFGTNKNLLLLNLSHNPLKFNESQYFMNSSSVQEFDISYCNMRIITNNTLKHMPGVMSLNLAGNNFSEIGIDSFKTLSYLADLDLSANNLKRLPEDIFSGNAGLETLHIQRNPIDSLLGLQIFGLLTLNAGETNIKLIGPSMFNGMTYIADLNLSGNSIKHIHNQAFRILVQLNFLDLSYNDLDFISEILIKKNIELINFKISNNPRLRHLPANGFNCSAQRFHIKLFDASNCSLEEINEDALKTFYALTQIDLSRNKIEYIKKRVFSWSPYLTDINLAYNLLTTLDNEVFETNSRLEKLNLQGNPLKAFSVEVFLHTPMLRWLDLSHAELTSLWKIEKDKKLFDRLRFLNVSYNHINEIKHTDLYGIKNLWTLDITNNPLSCTEVFKNTINYLSSRYISLNSNEFPNSSKETVKMYTWDEFTSEVCRVSQSSISTPPSVIQTTDANEEFFKFTSDFEDVLNDTKIFNTTKVIDDPTELNEYNQDDETDDNDKDKTNDDDSDMIDIVLPINDTIHEPFNSERIRNTDNDDTENSHVWPVVASVSTMILLIIIIICVKYVYKKRRSNMNRRNNLTHSTSQDSEINSGIPLLASYTNTPPQENESIISTNL